MVPGPSHIPIESNHSRAGHSFVTCRTPPIDSVNRNSMIIFSFGPRFFVRMGFFDAFHLDPTSVICNGMKVEASLHR